MLVLSGPDVTRDFLDMHNLSVVIRSHEGPDARAKRPMVRNDMMEGVSAVGVGRRQECLIFTDPAVSLLRYLIKASPWITKTTRAIHCC